jgi:hypothetical protein
MAGHDPAYYSDLYSQANFLFQSTIGNVDFDAENFQSRNLKSLSFFENIFSDNFETPFRLTGNDRSNVEATIESYILIKKSINNDKFEDYAIGVVFNKSFNYLTNIENQICADVIEEYFDVLDPGHQYRSIVGFSPSSSDFDDAEIKLKMNPSGKKYTITYYNAVTGQLLSSYTQTKSKPELTLPPLSGDNSCPIVYFVVKKTDKSNELIDTVFPEEYAKVIEQNFNFFAPLQEKFDQIYVEIIPTVVENLIDITTNLDGEKNVEIYSSQGILVYSTTFSDNDVSLNIPNLSIGIYIVLVKHQQSSYSQKIFKL